MSGVNLAPGETSIPRIVAAIRALVSAIGNIASPKALTRTNDTNVILTLGGTPSAALLADVSITVSWSGTLAAARLNSNVVQAVANDTNVHGGISAQTLTLSWSGTLAATRGGFGADVSASSGVPLFAAGAPAFTGTSGTGNFARVTSPAFTTPDIGAATGTSLTVGQALAVNGSASGVWPAVNTTCRLEITNSGSTSTESGQIQFSKTQGTPFAVLGGVLTDGTPPTFGDLRVAIRGASGSLLTVASFNSASLLLGSATGADPGGFPNLAAANQYGYQAVYGFSNSAGLTGTLSGPQSTAGGYFVAQNDTISGTITNPNVYGVYAEGRVYNDVQAFGIEADIQNLGSLDGKIINPNHMFGTNSGPLAVAIWSQPDGSGAGTVKDASAWAGVINNSGHAFKKGLVFGAGTVAAVSGHHEVLNFPDSYEIVWYNSDDTHFGRLTSTGSAFNFTNSGTGTVSLIPDGTSTFSNAVSIAGQFVGSAQSNYFGPAGTGGTSALLTLLGGSGTAGGGAFVISENSVNKIVFGTEKAVLNSGTSEDFISYTAGFGIALRIGYSSGALSVYGDPGVLATNAAGNYFYKAQATGASSVGWGIAVLSDGSLAIDELGASQRFKIAPTTGTVTIPGQLTVGSFLNIDDGSQPFLYFKIGGTVQSIIRDNSANIAVFSNAASTHGVFITHGADTWSAVSDARLPHKQTAREITERLPSLDGYRLYENEVNGQLQLFPKAQEVCRIFPHVVTKGDDDPDYVPTGPDDPRAWAMSYDRLGAIALAYARDHDRRLKAIEALLGVASA